MNITFFHSFFPKRGTSLLFLVPFLCLFGFLFALGPILHPDSLGYVTVNPTRSPIYPLILAFNTFLLGTGNYQVLVGLQLLFGFGAACSLAHTFRQLFNLEKWFCSVIALVVLLSPYYGPGKFGNAILTEAICYPLFLLAIGALLKGILQTNLRSLMVFLGFTALLILTRRQFLFLYPVFFIILLYLFFFERTSFKIRTLAFVFFISIIGTNLIERTYHYLYQGHFATVPFTGIQLVIAPLYISKASDATLFQTEPEKTIFQKMYNQMQEKKLSFNATHQSAFFEISTYVNFYENYNAICWGTLNPVLASIGIEDFHTIDAITTKMAFTLIRHNLERYGLLYAMNIIFNLGGLYYALFLGALFLVAFLSHFKNKTPLTIFCLITLLLTFGNYSLVALVEPVMRRYSAYTDTLQISMLLILAAIAFKSAYVRYQR